MRTVFSLLLVLLAGQPAFADAHSACRTSPLRMGPCFTVHGRLSLYNGYWNYRIWPVGSRRLLAVVDAQGRYDETKVPLPPSVSRALADPDSGLFADFLLCPLTRERPGAMRHVCIAAASHIRPVKAP